MKNALLAACAAVAICAAVPVVSTPAQAQAEKTTYDLFDMMYRLVREEGADNVADMELYQSHWLELNRRLEASADTVAQKRAFDDFPRPPETVIETYEAQQTSGTSGARMTDEVIRGQIEWQSVNESISDNHEDIFGHNPEDLYAGIWSPDHAGVDVAFPANADGGIVSTDGLSIGQLYDELDRIVREIGRDEAKADYAYAAYYQALSNKISNYETPDQLHSFQLLPKPMSDAEREEYHRVNAMIARTYGVPVSSQGGSAEPEETSDTVAAPAQDEVDTTLGGYVIKDKLWFFAGAGQTDVPQAGFGVEVLADDERFVAETDDNLTGQTFGGAYLGGYNFTPQDEYARLSYMQRKWKGRASAFTAGISYTQADGSSSGSVPAGGNGTGVVYFDFAPDDATGLFYGSAGSDVETSTDYENFRFNVGRKVYHEIGADAYWGCYHGLFYDYQDTEHQFTITTPTYADIYTSGRQDLTERYAGVELGPFFGRKFGNVNTFVRPLFNFGYREADLDAEQNTFCGLCYNSAVDILLDDDDSGFTYGGSVDAGFDWYIIEALSLGVAYQARWRADSARIVNPESGDDLYIDNQPTRLSTDDQLDQRLIFTVGRTW